MPQEIHTNLEQLTLAIHSTDDSFSFALRENQNCLTDCFFIRKFDKNLCNNLIVDFCNFVKKEQLKKINRISVSTGPANFNGSRQVVVLARTLSQQLKCSLDSFSSFELIANRIATNKNFYKKQKSFWIFKKLKRRGYIAGKYEIKIHKDNKKVSITEKISPKLFENLTNTELSFQAEFNDKEDLKQLLNLSNKNALNSYARKWEEVKPIYPMPPTN